MGDLYYFLYPPYPFARLPIYIYYVSGRRGITHIKRTKKREKDRERKRKRKRKRKGGIMITATVLLYLYLDLSLYFVMFTNIYTK